MTPWLILTVLVAAGNLGVVLLIRGRWGRGAVVLALASLAGAVAGDAVAAATGLELVRLGDYHLVAASIGALLAMLVALLLMALATAPSGAQEGRR